jgi:2-polyprenyl-3-methyl-5-hydroxy-6-metoxy-1,4-benzoquinol methylase
MKYYEMHEEVYKDLKDKGYVSWDKEKKAVDLFHHDINIALDKNLSNYFPKIKNQKALDLGTGTGTVALYLAKQGFEVTGYDMSSTAIELANKNAKSLGIEADFEVKDIYTSDASTKYDLVIDSSFFHCIVSKKEREKCYSFVGKSLNEKGMFFMHTMIQSDDMSKMLSAKHLELEGDILWSTGRDSWEMDWEEVKGKRVFAHRRVLSLKNLELELKRNGFQIIERELQENSGNPRTFIAWVTLF